MKASFYNFCRRELAESVKNAGFEAYRADQLFKRIYKENAQDFNQRFIPKALQVHAESTFDLAICGHIKEESISKADKTVKHLVELDSPKYKVECKLNNILLSFFISCSCAYS